MIPTCRRCPTPKMPLVTTVKTTFLDKRLEVKVALCQPCRIQASQENALALSRRTGKDVRP